MKRLRIFDLIDHDDPHQRFLLQLAAASAEADAMNGLPAKTYSNSAQDFSREQQVYDAVYHYVKEKHGHDSN